MVNPANPTKYGKYADIDASILFSSVANNPAILSIASDKSYKSSRKHAIINKFFLSRLFRIMFFIKHFGQIEKTI